MKLFLAPIYQFSSFPSGVIFTEILLPLETEDGQIIRKESFND